MSGADLRCADLSRATLIDTDLNRANLSGANLSDATLSGADLSYADLSSATLSGANLSDAFLFGATLSDADLSSAELAGAHLSDAKLSCANLSSAKLAGANMSDATLDSADLTKAILSGATLSGATLDCADLNEANLSGANLSGLNLSAADLSGANLSGANFSDADLSFAKLSGLNLSRATLFDSNLSCSNLSGANLSDASLVNADLTEANLSGADLSGANLSQVDLRGARVNTNTRFERNDVRGMQVDRSTLQYLREKLSHAQLGDLRIHDDVVTLRCEFGGIWAVVHLLSVIAFFSPHLVFMVNLWAKSSTSEPPTGQLRVFTAFCRYVWNGGVNWESGFDFNPVTFFTGLVFCGYNAFRVMLLVKTSKLESLEAASQVPVAFSFTERSWLKWWTWQQVYNGVRFGFWFYLFFVACNLAAFMFYRWIVLPPSP
jgi:uncharacterized protein YjbI with pentapeptide repeats